VTCFWPDVIDLSVGLPGIETKDKTQQLAADFGVGLHETFDW
jgi:hypothetical protein